MRTISRDQILILKRRQAFLEERLEKLGEYSGDSYDKNEVEALKTALWLMQFIKGHPYIKNRIESEESYDTIMGGSDGEES